MFKIQLGNPIYIPYTYAEFVTMEDSIEKIFPMDNDYLIMVWNNVFIPLSYKYDVSLMVNDFIKIIEFINDDKILNIEIQWASNTFACVWELEKIDNNIKILTNWYNVVGGIKDLLNVASENIVNTVEFKKEIIKLLLFLNTCFQRSIANYKEIEDIDSLQQVLYN